MDTREKLLGIGEELDGRLLVGDGAIGTLFAEHGIEQPPNKANVTYVWSIQDLHEEYLGADTRVIQTHTFSANHIEPTAHGLEEKVREVNVEGTRLTGESVDSLPRGEDTPRYGVEVAQNPLIEAKPLVGGDVIGPIV